MFVMVTEDKSFNKVLLNLSEVISFKPASRRNTANSVVFMKKYGDSYNREMPEGEDETSAVGVSYTFITETIEEIDQQLTRLDLRES